MFPQPNLTWIRNLLWGVSICWWGCVVAGPGPAWAPSNLNPSLTALTLAQDSIVQPMRGYYRWRNQEVVPQNAPAFDAYQRYQWKDLEPSLGNYNFNPLLNDLAVAQSQGRKFAFRVRMMAGYDDGQIYLPADLVDHASCAHGCGFWADDNVQTPGLTFVPDWNDAFLQQRASALLQALAQALGSTNLAWVDIGLLGQYGEWYTKSNMYTQAPQGILPVTASSKREFVRMHLAAFPKQQLLMFALRANVDALQYALLEQNLTTLPVGLRTDCLGRVGFYEQQWANYPQDWAPFALQWQKAPFVAEFCPFESGDPQTNPATARQQAAQYHMSLISNGNFLGSLPLAQRWAALSPGEQNDLLQLGQESGYRYTVEQAQAQILASGQLQAQISVRNLGSTPSYEPWTVWLELRDDAGTRVWQQDVGLDLRQSWENSSLKVNLNASLPALALGRYHLHLQARDSRSVLPRPALSWAVQERQSDGSLRLGTLHMALDANDWDGDGLPNALEAGAGLDPERKDHDIFADTASSRRLFIQQQFRDVLYREGSTTAVDYWLDKMNNQGLSRSALILAFLNSAPANNQIKPLARLMQAYFGNIFLNNSFNGMSYWAKQLSSGSMSLGQISVALAGSAALTQQYGPLTDAQLVTQIYQNTLARAPSASETSAALTVIAQQGRGAWVQSMAEQPVFVSQNAPRVLVEWLFAALGKRVPSANGEAFWLNKFNANASAGSQEMVQAYLGERLPNYAGAALSYRERFLGPQPAP